MYRSELTASAKELTGEAQLLITSGYAQADDEKDLDAQEKLLQVSSKLKETVAKLVKKLRSYLKKENETLKTLKEATYEVDAVMNEVSSLIKIQRRLSNTYRKSKEKLAPMQDAATVRKSGESSIEFVVVLGAMANKDEQPFVFATAKTKGCSSLSAITLPH